MSSSKGRCNLLKRNVDALTVQKIYHFEDISIRMGARWIPAEDRLQKEQFGIPKYIHPRQIRVELSCQRGWTSML